MHAEGEHDAAVAVAAQLHTVISTLEYNFWRNRDTPVTVLFGDTGDDIHIYNMVIDCS